MMQPKVYGVKPATLGLIQPMVDEENLGQRFAQELARSGHTVEFVAETCDVSVQAVYKWIKTGHLARKHMPALARIGIDTSYLLFGDQKPAADSQPKSQATLPNNASLGPDLAPLRLVPIVSMVQGGADGFFEVIGLVEGEVVPFYTRSSHAYALRVKGDSMRPRIRSGQIIVADPDSVYNPEDDVVVKLRTGQLMVKELLVERSDEIVVTSVNNGERWTIPKSNIEYIHCVVDVMKRGF